MSRRNLTFLEVGIKLLKRKAEFVAENYILFFFIFFFLFFFYLFLEKISRHFMWLVLLAAHSHAMQNLFSMQNKFFKGSSAIVVIGAFSVNSCHAE